MHRSVSEIIRHLTMASFAILLFLILPLQLDLSMATVTLSSSLTTNGNTWLSPSRDFAFGFHQLGNSNLFLLAIWFDRIPARTVVWHANGNNPLPRGSKVELTSSNLMLMDPEGLIIWQANPATLLSLLPCLTQGTLCLKVTILVLTFGSLSRIPHYLANPNIGFGQQVF
ncbi:hypothetical protein OIU78_010271 [Salix suchowensis]|nr:hypothetical protein OIU78_010271 [Salix suchowensis]